VPGYQVNQGHPRVGCGSSLMGKPPPATENGSHDRPHLANSAPWPLGRPPPPHPQHEGPHGRNPVPVDVGHRARGRQKHLDRLRCPQIKSVAAFWTGPRRILKQKQFAIYISGPSQRPVLRLLHFRTTVLFLRRVQASELSQDINSSSLALYSNGGGAPVMCPTGPREPPVSWQRRKEYQ